MGNFIGGIGAAFIMIAAVCVIVKFLAEAKIIADKTAVIKYGKVSFAAFTVGCVYVAVTAIMYNELKSRANLFDFGTVFNFLGISDTLSLCKSPSISGLFGGLAMPLYPLLVHVIGKLVFEEYALTAMFISFAASCVSVCFIYGILREKLEEDKVWDIIFLLLSLPFAFMLFTPSAVPLTVMFIVIGIWTLTKSKNILYIIMLIAACLTSKPGLLLLAAYPLKGFLTDGFAKRAEKSFLLNNATAKKICLSLLLLLSGMIICCLVRGIR